MRKLRFCIFSSSTSSTFPPNNALVQDNIPDLKLQDLDARSLYDKILKLQEILSLTFSKMQNFFVCFQVVYITQVVYYYSRSSVQVVYMYITLRIEYLIVRNKNKGSRRVIHSEKAVRKRTYCI